MTEKQLETKDLNGSPDHTSPRRKRKRYPQMARPPKDTTAIRQRVYDAIIEYMMKNQYPPCMGELCDMVGLKSKSSVCDYLHALEEQGYIELHDGSPRAIRVKGIVYVDIRQQLSNGDRTSELRAEMEDA